MTYLPNLCECPPSHFTEGLPHSSSDVEEARGVRSVESEDAMVKVARDSRLARIDALRNFLVRPLDYTLEHMIKYLFCGQQCLYSDWVTSPD